jgi:hypothetical protein
MPLEEGRKTWKDGEKFFENDKPPGSEYLTTYAYADSVLRDAGVRFPGGVLIGHFGKARSALRDRYVHGLYRLNKAGDRFEGAPAEKMLKTTLEIVSYTAEKGGK